ncbi:MAG TPA: hypothetical protein DEF30_05700 [Proteiniclasticum sp.]|uniref:hypothetical protein n=1 Tax=Proteiniclasticum sp. TaxID=2053595 RepID=UPI000E939BAD|nr:hypothetical protein [Proteiniclasticum sp.]HBW13295.1 hypothetical protein [Proteiniclasticum sp.]
MKQEIIKATLIDGKGDTDVLSFSIGPNNLEIDLNSSECQNSIKELFSLILNEAVINDIKIEFHVGDGYSRGMYIEVCEEYIKDLNRELVEVSHIIRDEMFSW